MIRPAACINMTQVSLLFKHKCLELWVYRVDERRVRHVPHDAGHGSSEEAERSICSQGALQELDVWNRSTGIDLTYPLDSLNRLLGKRGREAGDGARYARDLLVAQPCDHGRTARCGTSLFWSSRCRSR